jgi:hypothetical protein
MPLTFETTGPVLLAKKMLCLFHSTDKPYFLRKRKLEGATISLLYKVYLYCYLPYILMFVRGVGYLVAYVYHSFYIYFLAG